MKFVSRAEWGARYPKGNTAIGSTLGITLHWEGPHMGVFPHTACDDKVRGIERFHSVDRGWAGIAYNALVCPHGYVFEGRGVGIRSAANGDTQSNDDWYAVCYLGGERDGFTDEGKQGFRDAIAWLRAKGAAGPRVNGHRDHKSTACPGDEIYRWLKTTNFDTAAPTPAPTPPEDEVTPEDIKNIGQAAAAAVVEKLIPRPDAPDTNIRLGNAVAQAWHRSGRAVNLAFAAVEQSKRNAEALSALADSLDGGNLTPEQVADAIREAVGDRLQLEVTLRENPPEATS